jgi:hypothetical protein
LDLAYTKLNFSPDIIDSLAAQKADTLIGFLFILAAFLLQLSAIIFISSSVYVNYKAVIIISIIFIAAAAVGVHYSHKLHETIRLDTKKLAVREYCEDSFRISITTDGFQRLERLCFRQLAMRKGDAESKADFVRRVAEYVNWQIPSALDLSHLEEPS